MDRLIAWYRVSSSAGAVAALIGANAIPLVGALFFGWNVWQILIVYWLENGVVGLYTILKIRKAEGPITPVASGRAMTIRLNGRPVDQVDRRALIPFFVLHYGIFWVCHGVFVLALPVFADLRSGSFLSMNDLLPPEFATWPPELGPAPPGFPVLDDPAPSLAAGASMAGIVLAVIAMVISHGVSYWLNFVQNGEYRRISPAAQMFAPYGRLVVLHVTIIIGGMAIAITGAPAALLAVLVILKTALDLGLHLQEHRRLAAGSATSTVPVGS